MRISTAQQKKNGEVNILYPNVYKSGQRPHARPRSIKNIILIISRVKITTSVYFFVGIYLGSSIESVGPI